MTITDPSIMLDRLHVQMTENPTSQNGWPVPQKHMKVIVITEN
jgi:hypothetical protein